MTILCLSPHSDDAELGMGGTMAKYAAQGHKIINFIFSFCGNIVLEKEAIGAANKLGISDPLKMWMRYPTDEIYVRNFHQQRQIILQEMIDKNEALKPDLVFCPSTDDIHQDHQIINAEAKRAFKLRTLLGYELPWNAQGFKNLAYSELLPSELDKKIAAIKEYKSQSHRSYTKEENIMALARVRGMQAGCEFAECFEVIRYNI